MKPTGRASNRHLTGRWEPALRLLKTQRDIAAKTTRTHEKFFNRSRRMSASFVVPFGVSCGYPEPSWAASWAFDRFLTGR